MKEIWLSQREQIRKIALSHGLPPNGRQGELGDALRFGEMLTLVSDNSSLLRLMESDESGALSFLEVLSELTDAIETAEQSPSTSELKTPFHEIADFVVEFLGELRRESPDKFS